MLTALTDGPWKINVDTEKGYTLTAEYRSIHLPAALAPVILEACTPMAPPAAPAIVADTLGTALVMDIVLCFAISAPLDAAYVNTAIHLSLPLLFPPQT